MVTQLQLRSVRERRTLFPRGTGQSAVAVGEPGVDVHRGSPARLAVEPVGVVLVAGLQVVGGGERGTRE
jgi:hypothetical protein